MGVRAGTRCAACCILRPPGGSRGPGSLSGCSSQAHPAGARLFPQPPYAWLSVLSELFTTAARALPKMPAAPSRCGARLRGVIGSGWMDAAVSPSSRGAHPAPVAPVPLRSKVRRPPSQLGFAGFGTAVVWAMTPAEPSCCAVHHLVLHIPAGHGEPLLPPGMASRLCAGEQNGTRGTGEAAPRWDGGTEPGPGECREQRHPPLQPCGSTAPSCGFIFFLHSALHKSIRCDHRAISSPIPAPQPPLWTRGEGERLNPGGFCCTRAGREVSDARV